MDELSIKEIFKGIWKRKIIIIVFTVVFLVLGILFSGKGEEGSIILGTSNKVVKYASTIFTVTQTEEYKIEDSTVNSYFNILKTKTKMNAIIKKFDLSLSVTELAESIDITRQNYTDIIEISIVNEKLKDDAVDILNELLIILDTEIKRIYPVNEVYVIEKPYLNEVAEPKVEITNGVAKEETNTKELVVTTLAGIIIGFIIAAGLEVIDNTIKNEEQIVNLEIDNFATLKLKQKNIAEELRKIKLNLKDNNIVMMTELTNKRKNDIIKGLQELYAKYGKKVLYIDITNDSFDCYNVEFNDNILKNIKIENNKSLEELLEKEEIINVLKDMKKNVDIILINANNINNSINSLAMSKFVDAVVCVIEERETKIAKFEKMIKNMKRFECNFIGTILIKK